VKVNINKKISRILVVVLYKIYKKRNKCACQDFWGKIIKENHI